MEQPRSFAAWLKQRRRTYDVTQRALAEQVGCSAETIRKIEAAKLRPSRLLAQRLVVALQVPLDAQSSVVALARAQNVQDVPDPQFLLPVSINQHPAPLAGLPAPRTSFVGRDEDVTRLTLLLRDPQVRLVTLTGPPGVGKTRLAIEVARALATYVSAEVHFVALAALIHTDVVLPTIGQALNLVSLPDENIDQTLVATLRERPILLVLDNMEHLRGAARQLGWLLDGAPLLKLLVTSRMPLHLMGEQLWSVAPLAVHEVATSRASPAVELFVQRARAIRQDYTLQDHTVANIATLCARLDGLPLAIELAAARSTVLSPEALLRRFEEHLDLLTISPVDADTRHQTLRYAIGWSYALLDTKEQALLRCLSVFEGGCRLEMVQAVCTARTSSEPIDLGTLARQSSKRILDRLTVLVDHSLVEQHRDPDGEPRFTLLATIHAFAHEQAQALAEVTLLAERHAYAYAALLEWAEPQLHGPAQHQWFTLLDSELHNLRAALMWSQTEPGDGMLGLRLATALTTFWEVRGAFHEGWSWLERALTHAAPAPAPLRALALAYASRFAHALGKVAQARMYAEACLNTADDGNARARAIAIGILGDQVRVEGKYERAYDYFSTSLNLARAVGDHAQQTLMLERLGRCVFVQGDKKAASEWYEQSREVSERHGNVRGVARALNWLGLLAAEERDYERGAKLLQESLGRARALGYKSVVGMALIHLGELARLQGHYVQALGYYEQNRVVAQEMGNGSQLAMANFNVGQVALQLEDATRALAAFGESLTFWCESNFHEYVIMALAGYAGALRLRGQFTEAARLFGAAAALRESLGVVLAAPDQAAYERDIAAVRAHLGDAMFGAAWRAGEGLSLEGAVAEAHAQTAVAKGTTSSQAAHFPANLTRREVEVLHLLAHGLTNVEIAQRLVISPRTVNAHLTTIYRKLRVSSRSAATRFAVQHGLI